MAVQKNRKTRSRRNMRRSQDALSPPALSTDPVSGERHRRHHITEDGFYRGRRVIVRKEKNLEEEAGEQADT